MFILGKLLAFLENPAFWFFIVLVWFAWQLRVTKWSTTAKLIAFAFWIYSYEPLSNAVLNWWEVELVPVKSLMRSYPVAVTLGGYTNPTPRLKDRVYLGKGADRFFHALQLYRAGYVKQLLLTGGISSLTGVSVSEAEQMQTLYRLAQVSDSVLILEPKARTTSENASNSAEVLRRLNISDTVLLLTSAWHMRRAIACFEKQEVRFKSFSVDPQSRPIEAIQFANIIPSSSSWYKWDILIHEWLGLIAYKLSGQA